MVQRENRRRGDIFTRPGVTTAPLGLRVDFVDPDEGIRYIEHSSIATTN
jgi:hypothetical protein